MRRKIFVSEHDDGRYWAEVVTVTDETKLVEEVHHATGLCASAKEARAEARQWMRTHPEQATA